MDLSSIPKQYGGELDWKWGEMPNLDEASRELLSPLQTPPAEGESHPGFTKGPMRFKGDEIEVLGKVDGQSRQKTIPVPKQLAAAGDENGVPKTANGNASAAADEKGDLANGAATAPATQTQDSAAATA